MQKKDKYVTVSELARRTGKSKRTVSRAGKNGLLPPHCFELTPGGLTKYLRAHVDEIVAVLTNTPGEGLDLTPRAQRDLWEARHAELKYKHAARELILTAEVERNVTDAFTKLSQRVLQLPDRRASEWFQAKTVHGLGMLVENDLRDAMREFRLEIEGVTIEDGADHGALQPREGDTELN